MYIQNIPAAHVYFEHAEKVRKNERLCGSSAKWYIGKHDTDVVNSPPIELKLAIEAKKPCYDK
jgi:hypothetical protein